MEFVQERIPTLHDFDGDPPVADLDRAAVVVPMTDREYATLAAERTFAELEAASPGRVVVAIRSSPARIGAFREWLDGFDLPVEVLWCSGESIHGLLVDHGLDGELGKGRDVWLALGVATMEHDYVVCHDADSMTTRSADFHRLLAPLTAGFSLSKGYYARVEDGRLFGRLCRLLYAPLVWALDDRHDAAIVDYLRAVRYALAGEFGATASLARRFHVERRYGLEVGTLGDAFVHGGFDGTAQVDLGRYEHDHRAVGGPTGLAEMSRDVGAAVLRVVESHGVEPEYETLPAAYREAAADLISRYGADARFNGLSYDEAAERSQVEAYATAVRPPPPDDRLPPWDEASIEPDAVLEAARTDLDAAI